MGRFYTSGPYRGSVVMAVDRQTNVIPKERDVSKEFFDVERRLRHALARLHRAAAQFPPGVERPARAPHH
jgi:hypothetical protein